MPVLSVLALASVLSAPPPPQPAQPSKLTPGAVLLMAAGTQVDEPLLSAALTDLNPDVRTVAARVVAVFGVAPLAGQVEAALEKESDARAGAELLRAALLLRGDPAGKAEATAERFGILAARALKDWRARAASTATAPIEGDLMFSRVIDIWVPGLLAKVAEQAKCRLEDRPRFGYARVTYRKDGRPLRMAMDAGELSKECTAVLVALGRTTLAEEGEQVADGLQQWVVIPFSRDFAKCTNELDLPSQLARPAAGVRPPKKTRDVRPVYPREMLEKRVSGFVMAQGWISTQGCVTAFRVIKSDALPFELAALRAMSGWQFEPARRDGAPMPVFTTLTVSFSVR